MAIRKNDKWFNNILFDRNALYVKVPGIYL